MPQPAPAPPYPAPPCPPRSAQVGVKTIKVLAERMRNEGVQRAVMVVQVRAGVRAGGRAGGRAGASRLRAGAGGWPACLPVAGMQLLGLLLLARPCCLS